MYMGNFDSSRILTDVRRLCGQLSTGPTGVASQLRSRINLPIVPPPDRQLASVLILDPWPTMLLFPLGSFRFYRTKSGTSAAANGRDPTDT
jgi:hypothetical protein